MIEQKRTIEIYSAGCATCEETIALIKRVACRSTRGPEEKTLRAEGLGVDLSSAS